MPISQSPSQTQASQQQLSEPVRQVINDPAAMAWMRQNGVSDPKAMLGKLDGVTRDWMGAIKDEQALKGKYSQELTGKEFISRMENLYTQEAETDILYSKRVSDVVSKYNSSPAKKLKDSLDSGTAAVLGAFLGVFCAPEVAAFYVGKALRGAAEKASAPAQKGGVAGFVIKKLAPQKK